MDGKILLLFASEAGSAAGWNPYCRPREIALRIAARRFPKLQAKVGPTEAVASSVHRAKRQARTKPEELVKVAKKVGLDGAALSLEKVLARGPASEAQIDDVTSQTIARVSRGMAVAETAKELTRAESKLEDASSSSGLDAIFSAVKSSAYTSRGVRAESSALDAFAAKAKVKVLPGNTRFRKASVSSTLMVGGKEDGIYADGSAVIEIKCRQKQFFSIMPLREKAQLYVYMYVHGVCKGVWVQYFDGDVAYEVVQWEDGFWRRLVAGLEEFYDKTKEYFVSSDAAARLVVAAEDLGMAKH